jgi:hypothetical protein
MVGSARIAAFNEWLAMQYDAIGPKDTRACRSASLMQPDRQAGMRPGLRQPPLTIRFTIACLAAPVQSGRSPVEWQGMQRPGSRSMPLKQSRSGCGSVPEAAPVCCNDLSEDCLYQAQRHVARFTLMTSPAEMFHKHRRAMLSLKAASPAANNLRKRQWRLQPRSDIT